MVQKKHNGENGNSGTFARISSALSKSRVSEKRKSENQQQHNTQPISSSEASEPDVQVADEVTLFNQTFISNFQVLSQFLRVFHGLQHFLKSMSNCDLALDE